ncbi:MAG TPA: hypothetical protein VE153_29000 [Myxococcus sp.]|nr:hypothetical protein [Myxococcus sp.]
MRTRRPAPRLFPCLLLLALAACGSEPPAPEQPVLPALEVLPCQEEAKPEVDVGVCPPGAVPEAGLAAFRTECAQCHVNSDGWDLAHFGFSDADIVRRASAHVDPATACNIVAWVRGLDVPRKGPSHRPFRPGCAVALNDEAFGRQLFAGDLWPKDLTREGLLALRPREAATALPMLPWSDEGSRTDWMPEQPLPEALLAAREGALRTAIEAYGEAPGTERLLHAVAVFRELTEGPEGSGRICEGVEGFHTTAEPCFQARKWMAALAGLHVLRAGLEDRVPGEVVDLWWDVGAAEATLSSRNPSIRPIHAPSGSTWMYLSWSLDPLRQRTLPFYFPELVKNAGLGRHSAYTMLYSAALASESPGSERPYELVLAAVIRAPHRWSYDAAEWGLNLLLSNHARGLRPATPEARERARTSMGYLRGTVTRYMQPTYFMPEQQEKLSALVDQVAAGLQE